MGVDSLPDVRGQRAMAAYRRLFDLLHFLAEDGLLVEGVQAEWSRNGEGDRLLTMSLKADDERFPEAPFKKVEL